MNLVVDCMQVISGRPLAFFKNRQKGFLLEMFRRCLAAPIVSAYRRDLRKIRDYAETHNETFALWRNCEVYHPLDHMIHARKTDYFPYFLELLRVLIGMKALSTANALPDGYYRLSHTSGKVYEKRDGRLFDVTDSVVWKTSGFGPSVYFPRNGLFRDLLVGRLYPDMRRKFDKGAIKGQIARTLANMKGFSTDIWEDFQAAVSNVVLLTSTKKEGVGSMASTYKYFGAVFFNTFMNDEYKGVESLVHEYIHNRCTLWWETAAPSGIPPGTEFIVSPVTGNKVLASTMIHALIIYVCALQFYRFVQAGGVRSDRSSAARLNRRAAHLSRSIPLLCRRLRSAVERRTDMDRLLDYLMEVFEPLRGDL